MPPAWCAVRTTSTNRSGAVVAGDDRDELRHSGIRVTNKLIDGFSRSDKGSLEIDGDKKIVRGEKTFVKLGGEIPPKLRVNEFLTTFGTTLVQIEVDTSSRMSILGKALDAAQGIVPPVLISTDGTQFEAVGYIHKHSRGVTVKYDRGNPIRGLSQIPQISRSKPDERLTLLFLVNKGAAVEIETFQIGNDAITLFDPPLRTAR